LKDTVAAPSGGTRTFEGLMNVAAQPASLAGFGDLTLITKAYLSGQVSAEASTRVAGDASIAANLSSELVARASADTSIAADLSSELVARASAITSEASDRVAGDISLQNQIDFITSNVDAAAIDSLTEIVSAFQSADGDINGAITALSSTATSGLSTEVAARESADTSIAADLSSELVARASAIDNEASIRLAGDESIAADLSSELVARASAIDNEASIRLAADTSLESALSSEISRAEAAEDSLEVALSTEVSYLIANTDLTSIDSFSEVVADLSTEVARAESAEASIDSFIGFDEKGSAANDTYSLYLDILAGNQTMIESNGYVWTTQDVNQEFGPANYNNYLNFARYYFFNINKTMLLQEVTRAESVELSLATDFTAIYFKKATFTGTIDNMNNQFTLASSVRGGSETVYLNGLLQEAGVDYTVTGDVIAFWNAPRTGDKVVIYAVY
jgi:hypothetical protein